MQAAGQVTNWPVTHSFICGLLELPAVENFLIDTPGVSFRYIFVGFTNFSARMRVNSQQAVSKNDATSGRARILTAAKHLFATRGFDKTNRLKIAQAANVSPAFLATQFSSTEQLLAEVLDVGWLSIIRRIRALQRVQDPQRRLVRALELLVDSWWQDPECAELMLVEGRRVGSSSTICASSASANCQGIFDQYIAECRAAGSWPDEISNAAIRSASLALVEGLFLNARLYMRVGFPIPATIDEIRKLILVFMDGLLQDERLHPSPCSECMVDG